MTIYIFSEINYNDNKHINQYLFDYLTENNEDCYFIERVTMKLPNKKNILKIIKSLFELNKPKGNGNGNGKIIKCNLLPPFRIFKALNQYKINKLIDKNKKSSIISFVPHEHIFNFKHNNNYYYYCVHDSTQQGFTRKIRDFEQKLIKNKYTTVLCDNENVMNKLALEYEVYPNFTNSNLAILMPPPVPDDFFNIPSIDKYKYDFCYYGSFHHDIDIDIILELSKKYKILIISNNPDNNLRNNANILIINAIFDMKILANTINQSKYLLLPYKNSKFMNTITPAKAYQVQAFNKPILCSNRYLSKKYNFETHVENLHNKQCYKVDQSLSTSEVSKFILNIIKIKS